MLLMGCSLVASAHIDHRNKKKRKQEKEKRETVQFRENCDNAVSQFDQDINNVRARLLTGGDVWWDGNDGRYVVPKVPPGVPEVSSIFSGSVWLGGVDPAGNLKVAAQTGGRAVGNFDFFPGPLDPNTGQTEQTICANWDRFFTVTGAEIDEHLRNYANAISQGIAYDEDLIPRSIKGWPARGNRFFSEINQFSLPDTEQGLALFFDQNGNDVYEPDLGDYPIIDIRGCDEPQYPDEMTFWIYNDGGNIHSESMGDPIQMEIQVQAFAYQTNDQINDMTFQRYKLINRAVESINDTYFAMWVDPDLGCPEDDYIGCDTLRSLAYVYNEDAADGNVGCACNLGGGMVNTYCEDVPILGVDYFRGPLDEFGNEIGMSSFTYFNRASSVPAPIAATTDPENAQEYYNYISGRWRDGSPFTFGDDAFQDGPPIRYAFTEAPDDPDGWSMCSQGLASGDRRTVQASGPFRLDPGAVNELIIGVVWIPDQSYPCPSIRRLQEADDIAQALFDNCFELTDGPDAPDVDFIELDKEIVAVFTNDELTSNNAFEAYAQRGLQIPPLEEDSLYRFEGYKLYQLAGPDVAIADLNDPDKARIVFQVDIKNGVDRIFNWESVENPTDEEVYVPEVRVEGSDQGIRHTFRITEDQFAQQDRQLVNHKKYYFTAIAYAYNEYEPFDPRDVVGQRRPYLEGRRNIGDGTNPYYTVIPRPIVDRQLNAFYGEGPAITRIDGIGLGGTFVDLTAETKNAILEGSFNGEIVYQPGEGPIEVKIFNPLEAVDGEFELTFVDENMSNNQLDEEVRWELRNLSSPGIPPVISATTIERLNEQIIKEYGFSVTIGQTADVGDRLTDDNGVIGYEEVYTSGDNEGWLSGIQDGMSGGTNRAFDDIIFDFVATSGVEVDALLDPNQALTNIGPGYFVPYYLCNWRDKVDVAGTFGEYITPAWTDGSNRLVRENISLQEMNNIDLIFTPNKDLWSRCPIVETINKYYEPLGFQSRGNRNHFDLRAAPSVTKFDQDGDGLPDVDTDPKTAGEGFGWFPGYAIDVETGERLAVFFGENSFYDGDFFPDFYQDGNTLIGADMMFNPSSQIAINPVGFPNVAQYIAGGQHFVYVTRLPYSDETLETFENLASPGIRKVSVLREITWTGLIMANSGFAMTSYRDGLIPEEVTVKIRVDNPYQVATGTGEFNGYPTYRFSIRGAEAAELTQEGIESALNQIRMVPNPYYGFSDYETSQFTNIVKITNLPAKCTVTIYSLDGKFIRQYRRDETPLVPLGNNRAISQTQILPDLEWDMRNSKGIPIASGVYLIHVAADGLGERTLKWFGVNRKFDPSGL